MVSREELEAAFNELVYHIAQLAYDERYRHHFMRTLFFGVFQDNVHDVGKNRHLVHRIPLLRSVVHGAGHRPTPQ